MNTKIKSWAMWICLGVLVLYVVRAIFLSDVSGGEKVITFLFSALMAFGVVNNPDRRDGI